MPLDDRHAAEKFAVEAGETPINELKNNVGQKLLTADPRAYRAEVNRRISEYRKAQRQRAMEFTDRVKAEQVERSERTQRERDERKRASIENRLRTAYLASGGTDSEFDSKKQELVDAELERETVRRSDRMKRQVRSELRKALF